MKISAEYTTQNDVKRINRIIIDGSDTIIFSKKTALDLNEISQVAGIEIRNVVAIYGDSPALRDFLLLNKVSKLSAWLIALICKIDSIFKR